MKDFNFDFRDRPEDQNLKWSELNTMESYPELLAKTQLTNTEQNTASPNANANSEWYKKSQLKKNLQKTW